MYMDEKLPDGEQLVRDLLRWLGEDPDREGLKETPRRVTKAWRDWTKGYSQNPADVLKVFKDGGEKYDEMVVVRDIPFYSHCVIGSTFVETPIGRVPISRLKDNDWVYSVDARTFELVLSKCRNPRITRRNADLVRVYTDNDTVICTPDHRFLLISGVWKEAASLQNGDRLVSLYRSYSTVSRSSGHYPRLVASRYTRWDGGLQIGGRTIGIAEHRFVSSDGKGVVHHKNGLLWDNRPENLERVTISQHNQLHQRTQKLAHNSNRKKAAALASGRIATRILRAASVKSHWDNMTLAEREGRKAAMRAGIAKARNHLVLGVEKLSWKEDVWCMDVPETQTFFANGMAVHNCEHHLAPFFGTATIAYLPNGRIVGLSKLVRLLEVFSRRLQVQERITTQVADSLDDQLQPRGVGVVLRARHFCMETRGVCKAGTETVTSALRGCFVETAVRTEFLKLAR